LNEAFCIGSRASRNAVRHIFRGESGVVAILTALGLTVLIGMVGLAIDVGMWYRTDRALQNAADAAVIAAARNGTSHIKMKPVLSLRNMGSLTAQVALRSPH
jgi:Flp pilus assembly protein TadG